MQSAAMQQAKNAMQSTLSLTGGSYTNGTDFIISENTNGKISYWFEYSGSKLNDKTGKEPTAAQYVADSGSGENKKDGYYAVYFSTKCFSGQSDSSDNKIVNDKASIENDEDFNRSLKTLLEAIDLEDYNYTFLMEIIKDDKGNVSDSDSKCDISNGYFTLILTKTTQIEPTQTEGETTQTEGKTSSTDTKIVRIYYTPDIEPSLIIVLGENK